MAKVKRKITVTHCKPVYSGSGAKGPFTIHEIKGKDEHGERIEQNLSSFDDLTANIGNLVEYEITGPKDTRNGPTFTLHAPKSGRNSVKEGDAHRLLMLEEKVSVLEDRVTELYARLQAGGEAPAASPSRPAGASFGDDIPF